MPKMTNVTIVDVLGNTVVSLDGEGSGVSVSNLNNFYHAGVINDPYLHLQLNANANTVPGNLWVADGRYNIVSIKEAHSTPADAGGALTIGVATGTVTPANSTAQHSSALNMNLTANTVQTATLTTVTDMNSGDRICIKSVVNLTNLVGSAISLTLKRIV